MNFSIKGVRTVIINLKFNSESLQEACDALTVISDFQAELEKKYHDIVINVNVVVE